MDGEGNRIANTVQAVDFAPLLARSQPLLPAGTPPLQDVQVLKDWERNLVLRCRAGAASYILKRIKSQPACGYNEWAGLEFLNGAPGAEQIAPRLIGGDVSAGFYLMEDLGPGATIDDLLRGSDEAAVEEALLALAQAAARLHAFSLDDEDRLLAIRGRLPAAGDIGRVGEAKRWRSGLENVRAWFKAGNEPLPNDIDACCHRLDTFYTRPGPWLAFTHGDMAPTNNHVTGDRVRLLDFEYGAFRHAFYDITAWYVLCPLPEDLFQAMLYAYRATLAPACSLAEDDEACGEAWACMSSWRAIAMLGWIPVAAFEADRPWVEDWSCRAAILSTLDRLQTAASADAALLPLARAAAGLAGTLQRRWPEVERVMPLWPALMSR